MTLQIKENKAREWVLSGAPNHALEYLGDTVKGMSDFAEQNGILHKDEGDGNVKTAENSVEDESVNQDTSDVDVENSVSNEDSAEESNGEDNVESTKEQNVEFDDETTDVNHNIDVRDAFSKSLNETIAVAIKTYHDEIVVPLQNALKELTENTNKSASSAGGGNQSNMFEYLLGEDWLPASVMANTIKEQFAASDTSEGDETVTNSQANESATAVDAVLSNGEGTKYNVPGHLFNDF